MVKCSVCGEDVSLSRIDWFDVTEKDGVYKVQIDADCEHCGSPVAVAAELVVSSESNKGATTE